MGISELVLVEPKLVQDRCVDVAEMVALLDRMQSDVIGGTDDPAPFHTAACHPHRKTEVVMVAAFAQLPLRRSSSFARTKASRGDCVHAPSLTCGGVTSLTG